MRRPLQTGNVYLAVDDRDIVDKAIDNTFMPLIRFGDKVDKAFGTGDYKGKKRKEDLVETLIDVVINPFSFLKKF